MKPLKLAGQNKTYNLNIFSIDDDNHISLKETKETIDKLRFTLDVLKNEINTEQTSINLKQKLQKELLIDKKNLNLQKKEQEEFKKNCEKVLQKLQTKFESQADNYELLIDHKLNFNNMLRYLQEFNDTKVLAYTNSLTNLINQTAEILKERDKLLKVNIDIIIDIISTNNDIKDTSYKSSDLTVFKKALDKYSEILIKLLTNL